jgi:hypothetical protein
LELAATKAGKKIISLALIVFLFIYRFLFGFYRFLALIFFSLIAGFLSLFGFIALFYYRGGVGVVMCGLPPEKPPNNRMQPTAYRSFFQSCVASQKASI